MNAGKIIIDAEVLGKEESHDCGSGDYQARVYFDDGTESDDFEVFGDDHETDWSTLVDCSGPTRVPATYKRLGKWTTEELLAWIDRKHQTHKGNFATLDEADVWYRIVKLYLKRHRIVPVNQ
jgi:hypothetical protein